MTDFQQWYDELPFVTKHFMIGAFVTAVILTTRVISPFYLLLDFDLAIWNLQLWRFFTHFLIFGRFSMNFLFKMIMLYFGLSKIEKMYQPRNYADLFYLIIVNAFFLTLMAWIFEQQYMADGLAFVFIYIWCKRNPFERVQFLFGFIVSSGYLPWVILGYSVITGGDITSELMGLASAHLYIVLKDILPMSHQYNILKTPKFFEDLVNKYYYKRQFVSNSNIRQNREQEQNQGFRPFMGRGVQLQ